MTVRELKERLEKFDETLVVCVWDYELHRYHIVGRVSQGFNELDGALIIESNYDPDDPKEA